MQIKIVFPFLVRHVTAPWRGDLGWKVDKIKIHGKIFIFVINFIIQEFLAKNIKVFSGFSKSKLSLFFKEYYIWFVIDSAVNPF